MNEKTEKIRKTAGLNDEYRRQMGRAGVAVRTCGIAALPMLDQVNIWWHVAAFEDFSAGTNPDSEHDFGAFDYKGKRIVWTIDYYDPTWQFESDDPSDAALTKRVLTVMLASEY